MLLSTFVFANVYRCLFGKNKVGEEDEMYVFRDVEDKTRRGACLCGLAHVLVSSTFFKALPSRFQATPFSMEENLWLQQAQTTTMEEWRIIRSDASILVRTGIEILRKQRTDGFILYESVLSVATFVQEVPNPGRGLFEQAASVEGTNFAANAIPLAIEEGLQTAPCLQHQEEARAAEYLATLQHHAGRRTMSILGKQKYLAARVMLEYNRYSYTSVTYQYTEYSTELYRPFIDSLQVMSPPVSRKKIFTHNEKRSMIGPVFERKTPASSPASVPQLSSKFSGTPGRGFPAAQHRSKSAFARAREEQAKGEAGSTRLNCVPSVGAMPTQGAATSAVRSRYEACPDGY
ncbi:hypothetical protein BU15DRAFT_81842 [Melanogaster broomeanus]|nr:hypothetical protein BU15DRAFT_81842 [Melanogaster broomeanus]